MSDDDEFDPELIEKALAALSAETSKDQILQLMQDYEPEIVFLAAANPVLDIQDIERVAGPKYSWLPDESWLIQGHSGEEWRAVVSKSAQLAGIACNPNLPDQLLSELSSLPPISIFEYWLDLPRHCATLREMLDRSNRSGAQIGLASHPGIRLVLGQQDVYKYLLTEARSRNTDPRRLQEIYEMRVSDIQDRMGYPGTGGHEWYDEVKEFYLFHSPVEDQSVAAEGYLVDWSRPEMDKSLIAALRNLPHVWNPIRSFVIMEGRLEYSYSCAEVAANPVATFRIPSSDSESSDELTLFDQLREPLQPALHKWLESFVNEPDASYTCAVLKWIDSIKSMRQVNNLKEVIENLASHDLLTMELNDEDHDPHVIDPVYLDESEVGGLGEVVSRIAPYLGGTDSSVLQNEFELDSLLIKQAILLNPYCPSALRDSVGDDEDLFIPSNLEIARIAAYAGFYDKIPELLGGNHELGELLEICDEHVSEALTEQMRLNQSE